MKRTLCLALLLGALVALTLGEETLEEGKLETVLFVNQSVIFLQILPFRVE